MRAPLFWAPPPGSPAWVTGQDRGRRALLLRLSAGRHRRPAVPHRGRGGNVRGRPEGDRRIQERRVGLHRQRDRRQRRPDGRTIGLAAMAAMCVSPVMPGQKLPINVDTDLTSDRQRCRRLQHAGVRQARAVPHRRRVDRAGEEGAGQADLRLGRQRHLAASGGRAVQEAGRGRSPARAVPRRRPRHPGHGVGQLRRDVRQHAGVPRPDRRRRADPDRLRLAARLAAVSKPAADLADLPASRW